jgi:prevent-host-death family protein
MSGEIPARELRNDVSAVLRRVEAGETLTVTVSGRPVGRLTPLPRRPATIPWPILAAGLAKAAADPGLRDDLAAVLLDSTDDVA